MPKRDGTFKGRIIALLLILCLLTTVALAATSCSSKKAPLPDPLSIRVHTELQASYLADRYGAVASYADGTKEVSRPLPVTIDLSNKSKGFIKIELCENHDFTGAKTFSLKNDKAEIYNLKTDVVYYYRGVTAKGEKGEIAAIKTENVLPRNLMIEGITNARDLGGYQTPNGKVKQGLLYRTARLNQNKTSTPSPMITTKGISTMVNDLGIKTEIDLRRTKDNEIGALTQSVLGSEVNYYNCPMTASSDMPVANDASIKKVFSLLADESNYPLFFHCSIGTDRTGYCAFLMLTVLGVETNAIYRDYLFSNFGNIGGNRTVYDVMAFSLFLALQDGDGYVEKAENYLYALGVTPEEITAFRNIMIEK